MKVLKAVFLMTLTLGFLFMGLTIFEKLHCRQEFWHKGFKTLTSKIIKNNEAPYSVCRRFLYSSQVTASADPFKLTLKLGEGP